MTEDTPRPDEQSAVVARVTRNASQVLLPVILLLLYGFLLAPDQSEPAIAKIATVLIWSARIGAALLLVVAVICWTGALVGLLLDAVTSACLTLVFVVGTAILISQRHVFYDGVITAVFALVFARAALALWRDYPTLARGGDSEAATDEEERGEPRAPASTEASPQEDAPPPEGFPSPFADENKDLPTDQT